MEVGQVPVFGATSAISMFVWLLAVAYLYTEVTTDERAMGVFILPLLIALQAIPALKSDAEVRSSVLRGWLFGLHVSSLLFAYASFALAFVIGITYVLLFKEIKTKHLGCLLRAAAVAAGARSDEPARDHRRLGVPDDRAHRRRRVRRAGARL